MAPAARPSSVARRSSLVPGLSAMTTTPAVAIRIAAAMAGVTASPRKTRPNSASLHRLGLDVGVDHDEGAVVHGGEHQRGGDDLRQRAVEHPGPERQRRARQRGAGRDQHGGEKHQRERKPEQEPHMGRADGAELRGELALGGVAHGLRGGGDDGEDDPEPDASGIG